MTTKYFVGLAVLFATASASQAATFRSMSNPTGVTAGQETVRRIAADPVIGFLIASDSSKQRQARVARVEAWVHCTTFPLPCKLVQITEPKALPTNAVNYVTKHVVDTFDAMYAEVSASPRGSSGAYPISLQKGKLLDAIIADKPYIVRLFLGPA